MSINIWLNSESRSLWSFVRSIDDKSRLNVLCEHVSMCTYEKSFVDVYRWIIKSNRKSNYLCTIHDDAGTCIEMHFAVGNGQSTMPFQCSPFQLSLSLPLPTLDWMWGRLRGTKSSNYTTTMPTIYTIPFNWIVLRCVSICIACSTIRWFLPLRLCSLPSIPFLFHRFTCPIRGLHVYCIHHAAIICAATSCADATCYKKNRFWF